MLLLLSRDVSTNNRSHFTVQIAGHEVPLTSFELELDTIREWQTPNLSVNRYEVQGFRTSGNLRPHLKSWWSAVRTK